MMTALVPQMLAEKGQIDFYLMRESDKTRINNQKVEGYWRCETFHDTLDGHLEKVKVLKSHHIDSIEENKIAVPTLGRECRKIDQIRF